MARNVDKVLAERQTFGERLADRVAQLGGSWGFITFFTGMLLAWVVLNTVVLTRYGGGFDPYPYIFLNLILSMRRATSACDPMSQNRQAARDRLAATLDYEINLKAEVEIMALHDKLDAIRVEHLEGVLRDHTDRLDRIAKVPRLRASPMRVSVVYPRSYPANGRPPREFRHRRPRLRVRGVRG